MCVCVGFSRAARGLLHRLVPINSPHTTPPPPPPAVVDSHTFIQDYSSRTTLAARPDLGDGGNLRPVVDLLVEQIE